MAKKHNSGMTLIEVMIAFVIFALVVGPLFAAFSYSARMDRRALLHTLATYTAQMKMEEAYGSDSVTLIDNYNVSVETYFPPMSGIEMLYYKCKAEKYYPIGCDQTNSDETDYYDSLNLYQVTITIGNRNYGVEVVLTDIFYALP